MDAELRLYYAGEGRTELGDLAYTEVNRHVPHRPGVLEALVTRIAIKRTVAVGAKLWKDIPTLRPGGKRGFEQRRVGQLALFAKEAGADLAIFSRDRDRDRDREESIEKGIAEAESMCKLVGGTAIEEIEAWVLALRGESRSEVHPNPKHLLEERYNVRTTEDKVNAISGADVNAVPDDAVSLLRWLKRAREHLRTEE